MSISTELASYNFNPTPKNIIINGAMDIWQRGTSTANFTFGSGTVSGYTADRWKYTKTTSTSTGTVQVSTDVPTIAQSDVFFSRSLLYTVGTAQASLTTNEMVAIQQPIEGYIWRQLAQRPMALSFWVKSSIAGVYSVNLYNLGSGSAPDRGIVITYTINAANTWEYKTINIAASPSTGTWAYDARLGVALNFILAVGTTFATSTLNSWQTITSGQGANTQTNLVGTASATFYLTGVQLEAGNVATHFEELPYEYIIHQCQRYFEKSYAINDAPGSTTGPNVRVLQRAITSLNYGGMVVHHQLVRKRMPTTPSIVQPTVTIYGSSTGTPGRVTVSGTTDSTGFVALAGEEVLEVWNNGAAVNPGDWFSFQYTVDAEF